MKLLLTKKRPLCFSNNDFLGAFQNYSSSAESVHISIGYVSVESLECLLNSAKSGTLSNLELIIGMHDFDSIARAQYDCAMKLAKYLEASKRGFVGICHTFPYHGKVYTFHKGGKPFAAIMGSSNLSGLIGSINSKNYEVDIAVEDPIILKELSDFQSELKRKACKSFLEWEPTGFIDNFEIPGAKKLTAKQTVDAWCLDKLKEFEILLKTNPKSNLNACFAKGRKNTSGSIRNRPWYELEFIVPKSITAMSGYPKFSTFKVVTDDGWTFDCKTGGSNSKNFQSKGELQILGRWIKGRLLSAGFLQFGERVTPEILKKYGRNSLKLISTADPSVWLMDFSDNRS